jgi:hypothetical protein
VERRFEKMARSEIVNMVCPSVSLIDVIA